MNITANRPRIGQAEEGIDIALSPSHAADGNGNAATELCWTIRLTLITIMASIWAHAHQISAIIRSMSSLPLSHKQDLSQAHDVHPNGPSMIFLVCERQVQV